MISVMPFLNGMEDTVFFVESLQLTHTTFLIGYYLDNGASVCEMCHIDCEHSTITVEECRVACGISNVIVPPQLNVDQEYDKWGVPTTKHIKYPHTWYVPWCSSVSREDRGRVVKDLSHFEDQDVIVTEKMDGDLIFQLPR